MQLTSNHFLRSLALPLVLAVAAGGVQAQTGNGAKKPDPNPVHPPYQSEILDITHAGRAGVQGTMFWERTRIGTDEGYAKTQRGRAGKMMEKGIFPVITFTRWQGLYHNVATADDPSKAKLAWYKWSKAHRDYWALGPEGEPHTPWGKDFPMAWISPSMPLKKKDWPKGYDEADYGDLITSKVVSLSKRAGTRGVTLADGYGGLIRPGAKHVDFNPRTLRGFEARQDIRLEGTSISEKADDILSNHYHEWLDYWAHVWGRWQAEMANGIEKATGDPALIRTQGDQTPQWQRRVGNDLRVWLKHLDRDQGFYFAEPNAFGPHDPRSVGGGLDVVGLTASYEPDFRVGVRPIMPMKEEFDRSELFYRTADNLMGDLSDKEMQEWGEKYVKYHILSTTWLGVANRDGTVRRGIQGILRYRGDLGKMPKDIERLMNEHRFSAPYGLAVYFSQDVMHAYEKSGEMWDIGNDLTARIDKNGWPLGYFVSDAALDQLKPKNYPTGWVTSNPERLPDAERQKLEAIAPIYDLSESGSTPTDSPLSFSDNAGGYAFVDQNGNTILMIYRRDWDDPNAKDEKVTVHFDGLPSGEYTARDLLNDETFKIAISDSGAGTLRFELERWDARMFETNLPRPGAPNEDNGS